MIKKTIQNIFNFFGYKITKANTIDSTDLDKITTLLTNVKEPIIFDVGGNIGQSIERYKKLFPKCKIYSFDPIKHEVDKLILKYEKDKSIILNNVAIGEKPGNLDFNVNVLSGTSSFKNLIPNTTWIKERSKAINIESKNFIPETKKVNTKVITLDDYCKEKNIDQIDILKIDTQGYEDKVLEGAFQLLKMNKIKLIQLELIFSEIYQNPLSIYDVEKHLIPNKYTLFGISNAGSLITHYIYQQDHIYISDDTYKYFKKNKSPYFND